MALEREKALAGQFQKLCAHFGLPVPELQYEFAKPRKWRWDFAWQKIEPLGVGVTFQQLIALESHGGIWTKGRHTRGQGMLDDFAKTNAGTLLGWRILHCTPDTLGTIDTLRMVAQALGVPFREP